MQLKLVGNTTNNTFSHTTGHRPHFAAFLMRVINPRNDETDEQNEEHEQEFGYDSADDDSEASVALVPVLVLVPKYQLAST